MVDSEGWIVQPSFVSLALVGKHEDLGQNWGRSFLRKTNIRRGQSRSLRIGSVENCSKL